MRCSRIEQSIRPGTLPPIRLTKYAVRSMIAAGGERIVNIASIIASTGDSGLSVCVKAVASGFPATEMTHGLAEKRRLAGIEDVADAVEVPFGPRAKSITGTAIAMDAGNTV